MTVKNLVYTYCRDLEENRSSDENIQLQFAKEIFHLNITKCWWSNRYLINYQNTYMHTHEIAYYFQNLKKTADTSIAIHFNVIKKFLTIFVSIQWDPPQTSLRNSEFHCITAFFVVFNCWNKEYMKCPKILLDFFLTLQERAFIYSLPRPPVLGADSAHLCSRYLCKSSKVTATHLIRKESQKMGLMINQHK